MRLDIFVSALQAEDADPALSVGQEVVFEILGHWGAALGQEIQCLPSLQSTLGERHLRRVGFVEYLFSGYILEHRSLSDYGAPGVRYEEVLVDCGVPLILVAKGISPLSVHDVDKLDGIGIQPGRYLSGLALVDARISFRHPHLIERNVRGRIRSITELNLFSGSTEFGTTKQIPSLEGRRPGLPVVLEVDL